MNILAIGNKIISESLNMTDDLKPTEREIAVMVSFLHKLSSKASPELAALREAGEKMAEQLRANRAVANIGKSEDQWAFTPDDAAAIEAWEAANK